MRRATICRTRNLCDFAYGTLVSEVRAAGSRVRRAHPALVAGVLYAAAAIGGTWPLALNVGTHLPLGTLSSATVPLFNVWTLEWNARSLMRGYSGYWDAPIFHPTPGAFGLSEAQALTGAVYAVVAALLGRVAAYNLILLATLILNAWCARRLMRIVGAAHSAATATGLLALGLPFVWKELGVLQLTAFWPLWLVLGELAIIAGARDALRPDVDAPAVPDVDRARAIVRLAAWCAALVWTCTYYALFASVFLLLAAAFFARRDLWLPPLRAACLAACLGLLAAAAPLIAQQQVVTGYARSAESIKDGGATARAYTRLPLGALGAHVLSPVAAVRGKRSLYPGTLLLGFALLGAFVCAAKRPLLASRGFGRLVTARRYFTWCGVSLVLALVLSFGARWWIGSVRPYEVIVERYWPGFGNVRSPYRFGAFVQMFALVFAGVGFAWLQRGVSRRRGPMLAGGLLLMAAVVGFLEVTPAGARLSRFPSERLRESWIEFLAAHPGGAVVKIPPALDGKVDSFEATTIAMLQAFEHGHPLLNGYSGFFPPETDAYLDALRTFPDPRSKRVLARASVRYAVVDKRWLGTRSEAELAPLVRVFDSDTHAIYWVSNAR